MASIGVGAKDVDADEVESDAIRHTAATEEHWPLAMSLERRVLVWMCVLVAVNQLGFGAMVPSLPLYAQSFGVPASAIGMAVAAYGLARFATAIPAGQLSDRLGRRPTLAIGGLVSALGNLWCAWARPIPSSSLPASWPARARA